MSINKLRSLVRRGSLFAAAFSLLAGALVPTLAYADSLNPLTERSLTLSSSSPGWADTDGSGNTTYAPPNSGANGQKSGNYFSFKTSSDTTTTKIKAMSFQYCTASAGDCAAPGDDSGDARTSTRGADDSSHSDLNVVYPSAASVPSANFGTVVDSTTGNVKAVPGYTNENPKYQSTGGTGDPAEAAKAVTGNFIVMTNNAGTWTPDDTWTATTSNQEEAGSPTVITGKQNTIILQSTSGIGVPAGTQIKVLFFATASNYITNPGSGAFFVKINTFKHFTALAPASPGPENTLRDNIQSGDVIDGGVTVANVMNQSIQITTKVLETMQFSVGTVDPDTLDTTQLFTSTPTADAGAGPTLNHTACDTIRTSMDASQPSQTNVLQLGKQSAESSLETNQTYATHSYWRLSSNSSAGATVYYSGHTLSNTSGDEIAPIGTTAKSSAQGSEQFGLALSAATLPGTAGAWNSGNYGVDYSTSGSNENAADTTASGLVNGTTAIPELAATSTPQAAQNIDDSQLLNVGATDSGSWDFSTLNGSFHAPRLDPLAPTGKSFTDADVAHRGLNYYGGGAGTISNGGTAKFAFDPLSDTVPAPIASEDSQVVDCVTGKMRYIANIAATTPAGIYTTKINYIAAPQY